MTGYAYHNAMEEVSTQREMVAYWPPNYGDVFFPEDDESDELPPVNYSNIAYEDWSIQMSCRATGLRPQYYQRLNRGHEVLLMADDEPAYLTLLYKTVKSRSLHKSYDGIVVNLYTGYLRELVLGNDINAPTSYYLVRCLGGLGAWYISAPFFHYKSLLLDAAGYFWNSSGNESSSEEE